MDMTDLKFAENTFDGIWACSSFLHIPKKEALKTLKGFNRVLTKRGLLYVSVMEGEFEGDRKNNDLTWDYRHFSDYIENELKDLLIQADFNPFKKIKIQTKSTKAFLHIFSIKNN